MGCPDTGLLVVVDFDTPAARAVGLITAHWRHGRPSTAWSAPEDLTSVTAAAAAVVAEAPARAVTRASFAGPAKAAINEPEERLDDAMSDSR